MAMGNRKKAEEYMLKVVKDGDPTGRTHTLVKEQLAKMDDKRFHEFVQRVKAGKEFIPLIVDVEYDKVMDNDKALDLCDKYGVKIMQRFWYRHPVTGVKVLSNYEIPFIHMPVRRQIETLMNKISVAEDNTRNDVLTGQPIDGASAITQPESLVYLEKGGDLDANLIEKLKYRGGDIEGGRLFDQSLIETGRVSTSQLYEQHNTTTRVVQTADIYLTSAHYETELDSTK